MADSRVEQSGEKKVLKKLELKINQEDEHEENLATRVKEPPRFQEDPITEHFGNQNKQSDPDTRIGMKSTHGFKNTGFDPTSSKVIDNDSDNTIIDNRYEIKREIGKGGMGVVFLAEDLKLRRHVAVKRLMLKTKNMKTIQRRFLREAQTIASLSHPNIVNIFEIDQDERGAFIIMEYIPGPAEFYDDRKKDPPSPVSLSKFIKKNGAMNADKAEDFILKLCSAMEYAHSKGTLHRDIKPSNILLNDDLEPKLIDFGLAKPIDREVTEDITVEGAMLGTPEYSAPEQWGSTDDKIEQCNYRERH